jgi:Spy/CpxP family protein refolding chaperone
MNKRIATALAAVLLLQSPIQAQDSGADKQAPAARERGPHGGWGHHGMMGGCGMMGGPGMMGGWGMGGAGMMGWGAAKLDLTKDQRGKIYTIHRELRDKQFALMDKMHDQMQSAAVYHDGKFDEQAARRAYESVEKVHRQMFENMLEAHKKIDAILTPQQRQQLSEANK